MQQAKERERAVIASEFDPAEIEHGAHAGTDPTVFAALLPLIVLILVNLAMSLFLLPRLDTTFLAEERWGATSLSAVGGVWAVVVALAAAIAVTIALNYRRLPSLRASLDAGSNASVLPALSVASLVGFGAVVAALPAFAMVRDFVLSIEGGPLVSLALAVNVLAALTGSASGGLTIALDALGETLPAARRSNWHGPGAHASGRGAERRDSRQPTAQWRRGDAAVCVRGQSPRELFRPLHGGHCGSTDRARSRHCAWVGVWFFLGEQN